MWTPTKPDIHVRHWLLWASDAAQRWPRVVDWYRMQGFARPEMTGYRDHSWRDAYAWEAGDPEIADAIGRGMYEMVRRGMTRQAEAVMARYRVEGIERQVRLAERWGLSSGRVGQLATEGRTWVEAWCLDEWSGWMSRQPVVAFS